MGWAKCKPFALADEPTSATLILSRDAALGSPFYLTSTWSEELRDELFNHPSRASGLITGEVALGGGLTELLH